MTFLDENMRPIQYPLNRSQGLEYNTGLIETIDEPFLWSVEDPDERVSITLNLSLNEYVALASAIDVGRDIAYGQASLAIWWLWVRSVNPMAFCEQVNDCIDTNTATQISINNMVQSFGFINPDTIDPIAPQMPTRFPPEERAEEIYPPPASCDLDELWGGILEVVTRLDEIGLDFLQDVVSHNDKAERIANIIDLVPLFGDIAADVITIFSDIAPDLRNGYVAHSSQQVLEETACALFELVCEECRYPTYQEYYDHYASAGISGVQDIASYGITALMDYLIGTNGLANAVIWYTMNVGVLFTLYLGGTFLNRRGTKWLGIWASIGEENPSSAWEVLCDGCEPPYCYNFDFLSTDGLWYLNPSRLFGDWITAVGWTSVWGSVSGGWDERLYIWRDCELEESITKITVTMEVTGILGGAPNITTQVVDHYLALYGETKQYALGTNELVWEITDGRANCQQIRITTVAGSGAEDDIEIVFTSIKVEGVSPNPFDEPDNC